MAIVMFVILFTISKIFAVEINMTLISNFMYKSRSSVSSYLMAIVMFAIAITISKIFAVEMCMTLTFRIGQGYCKYINQKSIGDFPFDGKILVFSWYNFQDIFCKNMHDLDLQNGSMSNVNMPIESAYMICYLMAIVILVIFTLFVIIFLLFTVEICMTLTLNFRKGQSQTELGQWKAHKRLAISWQQ